MKVLWIINSPIGEISKVLKLKNNQGGKWINATMQALIENGKDIQLGIATTSKIEKGISGKDGNTSYYCINGGTSRCGRRSPVKCKKLWRQVIEDFRPDIIQIWGSELTLGLDVIEASNNTPNVVYMQGVISAIAKYPNGGLNYHEIWHPNIIDLFKCVMLKKTVNTYRKQAYYEKELITKAKNIISDNDWCFNICKSIYKYVKCYNHSLQMDSSFPGVTWNISEINRHSLFCVAGRGAYKGLHIAIKALQIVVKEYPDAKLYIPGSTTLLDNTIKSKMKQSPYISYLNRLIKEGKLGENVVFTGALSSKEMAEYMRISNVFIMTSCIENHSSTLREAMLVGTPVISSYVGSVSEFIENGDNGFLYRYEEYEILANYIIKLFENDVLATEFSAKGMQTIRAKYVSSHGGDTLFNIYERIIKDNMQKR